MKLGRFAAVLDRKSANVSPEAVALVFVTGICRA